MRSILAILTLLLAGCTITGAEREATESLHWLALKTHTDLAADTRWQFAPGTRIRLEELAPAADERWLNAAADGVYSVFEPPGADAELLLLIAWPGDRVTGQAAKGGWLPPASDPLDVNLKLIDLADERVVQTSSMRVDPHWFSRHGDRPAQIRDSFAHYAASIATSR